MMDGIDTDIPAPPRRPRTITVLVFLGALAVVISYLVAFALMGALASAEVIKPWARGADPRPKWFLFTFVALMFSFVLLGALARFTSWRQLRKIDAMEEAEDEQT